MPALNQNLELPLVFRLRTLTLTLAAAVGICLIDPRQTQTQSALRRITSTTEEGLNLNPSISGDGRMLAFESTEDIAGAGGSDHFRAIGASISIDSANFFQI